MIAAISGTAVCTDMESVVMSNFLIASPELRLQRPSTTPPIHRAAVTVVYRLRRGWQPCRSFSPGPFLACGTFRSVREHIDDRVLDAVETEHDASSNWCRCRFGRLPNLKATTRQDPSPTQSFGSLIPAFSRSQVCSLRAFFRSLTFWTRKVPSVLGRTSAISM